MKKCCLQILIGIIIATSLPSLAQDSPEARQDDDFNTATAPAKKEKDPGLDAAMEKYFDFQRLYIQSRKGVVEVIASWDSGRTSATGMFVSDDGLVLTRSGIFAKSVKTLAVRSESNLYEADLVAIDVSCGLAIVKLNKPVKTENFFEPCDKLPAAGEPLYAVSFPYCDAPAMGMMLADPLKPKELAQPQTQALIPAPGKVRNVFRTQCEAALGASMILVNNDGQAVGMNVCGSGSNWYAVDMGSLEALLAQARLNKPIALDQLHDMPEVFAGGIKLISAITFRGKLEDLRRMTFCFGCFGRGKVDKQVPIEVEGIKHGLPGRSDDQKVIRKSWKMETQECTVCAGTGVPQKVDKVYAGITGILSDLAPLPGNGEGMAKTDAVPFMAFQKRSMETIAAMAYDFKNFAGKIVEAAEPTLSQPQKNLGKPVAFYATPAEVTDDDGMSYLLMKVHQSDRYVIVTSRGKLVSAKGKPLLVCGILMGGRSDCPHVAAVTLCPPHGNPKLDKP